MNLLHNPPPTGSWSFPGGIIPGPSLEPGGGRQALYKTNLALLNNLSSKAFFQCITMLKKKKITCSSGYPVCLGLIMPSHVINRERHSVSRGKRNKGWAVLHSSFPIQDIIFSRRKCGQIVQPVCVNQHKVGYAAITN